MTDKDKAPLPEPKKEAKPKPKDAPTSNDVGEQTATKASQKGK